MFEQSSETIGTLEQSVEDSVYDIKINPDYIVQNMEDTKINIE